MYFICQVTLHDRVIKRSCVFMEESSSLHATTMPRLVAIVTARVDSFLYLFNSLFKVDFSIITCNEFTSIN